MPAQTTIPSKISITIDRETKIFHKTKFTQYLSTNPALQRILEGKLQQKEGTCTKEKQEINHFTTKPNGENHIHTMPPTKTNMTGTNSHLSLISLNINGLNSPIKRQKLTDWINKQDPAF